MKKLILGLATACLAFASASFAGPRNITFDYARVVHVEPVYYHGYGKRYSRDCYRQPRVYHNSHHSHHHNSVTPTIVGAIIGSAVGNAIGNNKSTRKVGAVAGAILGGSIGHDLGKDAHYRHGHDHQYHTHHHGKRSKPCSVSYEKRHQHKRIKGYSVIYRYRGDEYETFMRHRPGKRIKIKVKVSPAGYGY